MTLFAVPKPFTGRTAMIQRNAVRSWTLLRPRPEIVLFGDEEGMAEAARELGVRHEPAVARNEFGTPLLNDVFARAERLAAGRLLCFLNADMLLLPDFARAVRRARRSRFLMVGRRWEWNVEAPLDFAAADWAERLRVRAVAEGKPGDDCAIDYFVFTRGLWREVPPFAIGRPQYDNWLIYRARALGAPVIDAGLAVMAIHQSHDYGHVRPGATRADVWAGPEAQRNRALAGGVTCAFTLRDATSRLLPNGRVVPLLGAEDLRRRSWRLPVLYPRSVVRRSLLRGALALGIRAQGAVSILRTRKRK